VHAYHITVQTEEDHLIFGVCAPDIRSALQWTEQDCAERGYTRREITGHRCIGNAGNGLPTGVPLCYGAWPKSRAGIQYVSGA